ncbi:hypothetical protein [Paenibacillus sp. JCM 10914]|uniref:hypothetical protein n=1 Tax=Paenibacillus sp. JCM 10914 TaxID=1236974 RepID=UPI0003CC47CF|nr:hypothetical protein [Paenibacillus sp. JCM 10914]GAE06138.1 conserved hypothetical protein-putative secreted protein [Paenibacillus sp. JCM 10914]
MTDASTHRYTDRLAEAAASFFVSQLKVKVTVGDVKLASIESQRLWCSPSGQVLRDQKGARSVLDLITDRCDQWATARARIPIESRRARMRQWMHEKVYAARKPCALNPRVIQHGDVGGLQVDYRLWWSQQGVMNSGYVFRPIAGDDDARLPLTVAVWRDGTRRLQEHWSWIRNTCESGRAVMVLNVSGVGPHEPHPIYGKPPHAYFGVMHKLADDLIWLGDSLAAMRTFDVLRCLEVIKWFDEWQHEDLRFYTAGREGLYVQFASTIDDSVRDLTAVQGVDRLADWATAKQFEEEGAMSVLLPGILQVLDLPELQELRTANLRQ